jgi:hypothetical protein
MGNQNRKSKKNRQYNGQWGIRTVNQRRTDNTMAKVKRTKDKTMISKNTTQKT